VKIAILTQPLSTNYGGLLQAYALQFVLKKIGHEVWTIDKQQIELPLSVKYLSISKRLVSRILHHNTNLIRVWATKREQNKIAKHTNIFINENINTTKKISSSNKLKFLKKHNFNAYIVGSDQVWRLEYSPFISNYFLDFIEKKNDAKRIAYSASFGVDEWEFSSKLTQKCASLAQKFDAISVREDTAIKLCKDHLDVEAIQVLDPTMLLKKEDYINLVEKDKISKSKGSLMLYVLDKSKENNEIIQIIVDELGLNPFLVMAKNSFYEVGKNKLEDCIFPPVTEWIRGFMDAEFVITDSFHGTVFSIIFNKPFISIGNKNRGLTRLTSVLKIFGLEERLILSKDELTIEKIKGDIDFEHVNRILETEKCNARMFLFNALNN